MEAGVLAFPSEFALHSNYHRTWRGWVDRSIEIAAPDANYGVAVDEQWSVHCVCGVRNFLGLSNEGAPLARVCVRTSSALAVVLGGLHSGDGSHRRLALTYIPAAGQLSGFALPPGCEFVAGPGVWDHVTGFDARQSKAS